MRGRTGSHAGEPHLPLPPPALHSKRIIFAVLGLLTADRSIKKIGFSSVHCFIRPHFDSEMERPAPETAAAFQSLFKDASIKLKIKSAAWLPAMDRGGTSDPYCKVALLPRDSVPAHGKHLGKGAHRTPTVKKTLHPVWGHVIEFPPQPSPAWTLVIEACASPLFPCPARRSTHLSKIIKY